VKSAGVSFPITAFVGPNGAGKTLAMVETLAVPAIASGKQVLANFTIRDARWVPLRSWRQLSAIRDAVVLLDEISSILPSRQFGSLPPELLRRLNQLRKARVTLGWSAPAWARCDVALRECTQGIVLCTGYLPDSYHRDPERGPVRFPRSGRIAYSAEGRRERVSGWRPNRLFQWATYDAREFDDWNSGVAESLKPFHTRYYWRPAHAAHRMYSTSEEVMLMDHLDDVGTCVVCNGTRQRHKCSCTEEDRKGFLGLVGEDGHVAVQ
jgi:hypothetical protein